MVMDIAAEKHLGKEFELDRNIIVFIVQIFNSKLNVIHRFISGDEIPDVVVDTS